MKGSTNTEKALANKVARMALRKCGVGGCERNLRANNETGLCFEHKRMNGRCVSCRKRIDRRFAMCATCRLKARAAQRKMCDCGKRTRSALGMCRACSLSDRSCVVDGCGRQVAAWSESGYCGECRRRGYAPRRRYENGHSDSH